MRWRKTLITTSLILSIVAYWQLAAFAHPGRTDSNGGHWDRKNGTYHYHSEVSGASGPDTATAEAEVPTSIQVRKPSKKIRVGDSVILECVFTPLIVSDKKLTWSSSDETIAKVSSDGTLTAVGAGDATITATSTNGITDQFKIRIFAIDAEAISFVDPPASMEVNSEQKITCLIEPENTTDTSITWLSSNDAVMTVDASGNVKAIAPGNAAITATTANNLSVTCDIDVYEIEVEEIQLEMSSTQGCVNDIIALDITILPENATDKEYTLNLSDPELAQITDDNKLVLLKAGDLTITAKANNGRLTSAKLTIILPVTEIEISPENIALDKGAGDYISYKILPENATFQNLTWTSLDESIATVDELGYVQALAYGKTAIKVTAHNGVESIIQVSVDKPVTALGYIAGLVVIIGAGAFWIKRKKGARKFK